MNDLEAKVLERTPKKLLIGGIWTDSSDGETFKVYDPATELVLAEIASASVEDGKRAMDLAHKSQESWSRTAPRERGEILRRAFEMVTAQKEDFARLMSMEMGKPFSEALGEVAYGAEFLRWFSEEAVRISGRYSTAPDGRNRLLVLKKAVGPALMITPWNFPLAMATRKIGPAIAAGCTMILKPAGLTPLTSMLFGKVLMEAGLPEGVLSIIPTKQTGPVMSAIIDDPRLRKLSFTGSTEVGQRLISDSAKNVLRISMELGGNAPFLVFEDADVDSAVDGAMLAKLRNMGEACTAANRFLVHSSVAEDFSSKLAARMAGLKVSRGLESGSEIGPLIDQKSRDAVHALVENAISTGAKALTGGIVPEGDGYFYPPTVLVGVNKGSQILKKEIFGPVAPISVFDTEDEAIEMANDVEYGLVAYAYTKDLNRGLRLAERIEVGMFGLNVGVVSNPAAPFGGVKSSGLGREGGAEGIEEYLETVYVGISDPMLEA